MSEGVLEVRDLHGDKSLKECMEMEDKASMFNKLKILDYHNFEPLIFLILKMVVELFSCKILLNK